MVMQMSLPLVCLLVGCEALLFTDVCFVTSPSLKSAPKIPSGQKQLSGLQKGPAERGHVKKRQKSSKSVKKFFDTFRPFSRRAKNVKKRQKGFSTVFAQHHFSGPRLLGGSEQHSLQCELAGHLPRCQGKRSEHSSGCCLQMVRDKFLHGGFCISETRIWGRILGNEKLDARILDPNSWVEALYQCHAEGGVTKGGVSKCEQTQTNADKRRGETQRRKNASKREQTWTNASKRLHSPLLRFFAPPFAIPLF